MEIYVLIRGDLLDSREKSRIVTTQEFEYLGFCFVGDRTTINVSSKSIHRFKQRIRCWYWKRWRHVRTRIRELVAMKVPLRQAIRRGISRQGPWYMSKTIGSGVGMTNNWLASKGFLSMKTLWAELAQLRGAA